MSILAALVRRHLWKGAGASLEEVIEWLKRYPNAMPALCEIEIRHLHEAAEFGEEFIWQLAGSEDRLRKRTGHK